MCKINYDFGDILIINFRNLQNYTFSFNRVYRLGRSLLLLTSLKDADLRYGIHTINIKNSLEIQAL